VRRFAETGKFGRSWRDIMSCMRTLSPNQERVGAEYCNIPEYTRGHYVGG
jgi:hypothetical protein